MYYKQVIHTNENGEVINENTFQYKGTFDEEEGYLFWNRKNAVKSFEGVEYPESMNDMEVGRLARLSKKIWAKTNMLGYRGNGGVKAYDDEGISKVLGVQIRQGRAFIKKMMDLGIMAKVVIETDGSKKEFQYYLNPIYFFSSNRIPLNLYLIFKDQLDTVIDDWVKESYNIKKDEEQCP